MPRHHPTASKSLRFASLERVSTESQEQRGESLRTQRKYNERDVARLGGTIVAHYGGQEHATPGWEKAEVDRLLADAAQGKFDAVIVAYANRWSRDNAKSKAGLEVFRRHGVRFFVGSVEKDLFEPSVKLELGIQAEIGEFVAGQQVKMSIENRIERAKRGVPTSGALPFGRTYDATTGQWAIDPAKQKMVMDAARRYLAGEPLPRIAYDCGMNHSSMCKLLRERCGDTWVITFNSDMLNIHETVTLTIPRLLDDQTIQAVRRRLVANRTYLHKPPRPVHDHLLSGYIFCSACGYGMFGQVNTSGRRYYRHAHAPRARACPHQPRPWVPADAIEQAAVGDLFDLLGNTAAIDRAIKSAIPDCADLLRRKLDLEVKLAKIERGRAKVLELVTREALTLAQAEDKLTDLKKRETDVLGDLDAIKESLTDLPNVETARLYVQEIQGALGKAIMIVDDDGNTYAGGNDVQSYLLMTQQDRHDLLDSVFAVPQPGGQPSGVYITPRGGPLHGPKRFSYQIKGRLGKLPPKRLPGGDDTTARIMPSPPSLPDTDLLTILGNGFTYIAAPCTPIVGIVRDKDTGKPIPGAIVTSYKRADSHISAVTDLRAVADKDGRYRLLGMPKGDGNVIRAGPPDGEPYLMSEQRLGNTPGLGPMTADFALKRGVWITGRVLDKATRQPVPARVEYVVFADNPHRKEVRGLSVDIYLQTRAEDGTFPTYPHYLWSNSFHTFAEINPATDAKQR
jgi:DNA invertase Pin-like site-specific DNA recombinase